MLTPEEFAASLLDDWNLESVIKKIAERDRECFLEASSLIVHGRTAELRERCEPD